MSDIGSFASPKDKYLYRTVTDMKSIEIENENENVQQCLLSHTNEKRNKKTLNTESKGEVTIEGEYGTLKFER